MTGSNQQQKSGISKVLIAVVVLALVAVICTGVCGGGVFWGWGMFEEQAQQALNENAVIEEHIGEIESMSVDLVATGDAGAPQSQGGQTFVFRVEGSKGTGVVSAEFVSSGDDTELLMHGTLELPNGEVLDLFPDDEPPPHAEDLDDSDSIDDTEFPDESR